MAAYTSIVEKNTRLIELRGVSKSYDSTEALIDINLYIRKKEFITLLGPSGCGKTTMLRLIAGFEQATTGDILFNGADITGVPPWQRRVNTVFQKYALFPHLNVFENIAFGLRIKKTPNDEVERRVQEMLTMVDLPGKAKRMPEQLSGGQQQRVAIARALINEPEVLLLDEPLGALDLKLRKEMQIELKRMQQRVGITFVYVTHDQEEALTMSDTVVVMNEGRIQQIGKPIEVYNDPVNAYVADFIGESNILRGVMIRDEVVRFMDKTYPCVDTGFGENAPVDVVIRPEDIRLMAPDENKVCGVVESVVFKGVHYEMSVVSGDYWWTVHDTLSHPVGAEVSINVIPFDIHIMKPSEVLPDDIPWEGEEDDEQEDEA